MKKLKMSTLKNSNSNGITLVALVITVIIIIILATVAISFAFGNNGLINRAEDASGMYANDTAYTEGSITNVEAYINDILIGASGNNGDGEGPTESEKSEVVQARESGKVFTDTDNPISDAEGNRIKVPAGFKIALDSGDTVQQGIVIEDVSASTDLAVQGSQFVWIPVGVFIKDGGTQSNEIVLGRYTYSTTSPNTPILQDAAYTTDNPENYKNQKGITNEYGDIYTEVYTHRDGTASDGTNGLNATSYNLEAWVNSVKNNGGYYIGRYEASFASGTSVANYKAATKSSTANSTSSMSYSQGTLWNFITQLDASKVAMNTYSDSTSVKSDLMNSYAWDTALVFIQEAGHTDYANKDGKSINSNLANTGSGQDEVCNINDMASNLLEWNTEHSNRAEDGLAYPCLARGGYFENKEHVCGERYYDGTATYLGSGNYGFRLTLYIENS